MHLSGRSAVVSGSSRGIGRAVALALAAQGAGVVVNGREAGPVAAVVEEIRSRGGMAVACPGSVTDFAFAGALVDCCVEAFGAIDVLVNCAGVPEPAAGGSILEIDPEAWQRVLDVHLGGSFHTCRQAAPRMREQGRGAIVNTSSHAWLGLYGGSAYPAAKGATNSLTFALAAELREHGIRVNAVCPGAKTRLSSGESHRRRIRALHARGLLDATLLDASLAPPEPHFLGPVYAFLASDLSQGISGRIFSAAGGYLGVFATGSESLLAYREPDRGPWALEELARELRSSPAL